MTTPKINLYEELIGKCEGFERKGKSVPYTSVNGHMFSQLNKDGELGIRFSKEAQEKYIQELNTTAFKSYGAVMQGYVLMPEHMWEKPEELIPYLMESYEYVKSLEPK